MTDLPINEIQEKTVSHNLRIWPHIKAKWFVYLYSYLLTRHTCILQALVLTRTVSSMLSLNSLLIALKHRVVLQRMSFHGFCVWYRVGRILLTMRSSYYFCPSIFPKMIFEQHCQRFYVIWASSMSKKLLRCYSYRRYRARFVVCATLQVLSCGIVLFLPFGVIFVYFTNFRPLVL